MSTIFPVLIQSLKVFVYLEETQTILDTSVCVPRRSFFLEEARPLFKSLIWTLTSVASLELYWYQLQTTCLRTPIILSGEPRVFEIFNLWNFGQFFWVMEKIFYGLLIFHDIDVYIRDCVHSTWYIGDILMY